jgi:hypothetical protein
MRKLIKSFVAGATLLTALGGTVLFAAPAAQAAGLNSPRTVCQEYGYGNHGHFMEHNDYAWMLNHMRFNHANHGWTMDFGYGRGHMDSGNTYAMMFNR